MKSRLIFIVMFLLSAAISSGQSITKPTLSHQQLKNLQKSLNLADDATQIGILLQLAGYYVAAP